MNVSHRCLWIVASILLILLFMYIYVYPHRTKDEPYEYDDVWYHNGVSTCVCYGEDPNEICPKSDCYCVGGDVYGSKDAQLKAVREAIQNGGEHSACPLL